MEPAAVPMERAAGEQRKATGLSRLGDAAAALLVAKRLRNSPCLRLLADHSTFSALNIDVAPRAPYSSPFANLSRHTLLRLSPVEGSRRQLPGSPKMACKPSISRQSTGDTCAPDSDDERLLEDEEQQQQPLQEPLPEEGGDFVSVRTHLLSFRKRAGEVAPPGVRGLSARSLGDPAAPEPPEASAEGAGAAHLPETPDVAAPRAAGLASPSKSTTQEDDGLCSPRDPPPNGAKRGPPKPDSGELKRAVQSHLNKVCPENVATIAAKIAAIEIRTAQQLEVVIELMFKKAVTEPHYCETYADLVFGLKSVFPDFPSPDGGRPISFKSSVLNICQGAFEEFLTKRQHAEEQCGIDDTEMWKKERRDRMRANMKFIGHLYLRQLLSTKVIGSVSRELVHGETSDDVPDEHALDCACELLMAIGFTLESMPAGQEVVQHICGRLLELKSSKTSQGKSVYCKRVQFMIQDLLETRAAGWARKLFRSSAKTRDEIRLEQERDLKRAKSCGLQEPAGAERVVVGQRPYWLAPAIGA